MNAVLRGWNVDCNTLSLLPSPLWPFVSPHGTYPLIFTPDALAMSSRSMALALPSHRVGLPVNSFCTLLVSMSFHGMASDHFSLTDGRSAQSSWHPSSFERNFAHWSELQPLTTVADWQCFVRSGL